MGTAKRDSNGKFLPGNQLAVGNRNEYKPRTHGGHFKSVVTDILAGITSDEVLRNMRELSPETFMYIYVKLQELESDNKLRDLKAEVEAIKLDRESSSMSDSNVTIEISYDEPDDE